jgi:hypothetical protein
VYHCVKMYDDNILLLLLNCIVSLKRNAVLWNTSECAEHN